MILGVTFAFYCRRLTLYLLPVVNMSTPRGLGLGIVLAFGLRCFE